MVFGLLVLVGFIEPRQLVALDLDFLLGFPREVLVIVFLGVVEIQHLLTLEDSQHPSSLTVRVVAHVVGLLVVSLHMGVVLVEYQLVALILVADVALFVGFPHVLNKSLLVVESDSAEVAERVVE